MSQARSEPALASGEAVGEADQAVAVASRPAAEAGLGDLVGQLVGEPAGLDLGLEERRGRHGRPVDGHQLIGDGGRGRAIEADEVGHHSSRGSAAGAAGRAPANWRAWATRRPAESQTSACSSNQPPCQSWPRTTQASQPGAGRPRR